MDPNTERLMRDVRRVANYRQVIPHMVNMRRYERGGASLFYRYVMFTHLQLDTAVRMGWVMMRGKGDSVFCVKVDTHGEMRLTRKGREVVAMFERNPDLFDRPVAAHA